MMAHRTEVPGMTAEALDIAVKGVVQGVGFRPFVYRLAHEEGIVGWVVNDVAGVTIHAEGTPEALDRFVVRLSSEEPSAAQVTEVDLAEADPQGFADFTIQASDDQAVTETTLISPDLGICEACARELLDPSDRRFRYPFINCTNCGPRFTIIDRLPYDRPNTSMAAFSMCPACQAEYDDPANRRFHAQPDACFDCGPRLGWAAVQGVSPAQGLEVADVASIEWADGQEASDALIARAVELLRQGGIVAVKGLGGYHLACDASNLHALTRLRQRKQRPAKPLAVMVESAEAARAVCAVDDSEQAMLESPARPIVLLRKRPDAALAPGLADGVPDLGVMLPATPVQLLLVRDFGGMLVMTSGNSHDDPICMTEGEAFSQLSGIADAFLVNDRPIVARYDDSVLRIVRPSQVEGGLVQFFRRARGFAPTVLGLPAGERPLVEPVGEASASSPVEPSTEPAAAQSTVPSLAVGSQQKNTFSLTRGTKALVSQHIGDMDNVLQLDSWRAAVDRCKELFAVEPRRICCDLHPDYVLSKHARALVDEGEAAARGGAHDGHAAFDCAEDAPCGVTTAANRGQSLSLVEVQHHYAHVLSVMGENALEPPVCGFVFDGTGYGMDGAIWGGEVLLANYQTFERLANLAYFPLPGGAAAIKDPCRAAFGLLWSCDLLEAPAAQRFVATLDPALVEAMSMQVEQGLNAPHTSSMGRLFDAVSALLGVCRCASYDGQPAIELENALWRQLAKSPGARQASAPPSACSTGSDAPDDSERAYEFGIIKNVASHDSTAQDTSVLLIDPEPVLSALLDDLDAGVPVGVISQRFHDAVSDAVVLLARFAQEGFGIERFALTGGVFQNRYVLESCIEGLAAEGCAVALNIELPPNDGNVSYGQAVLA